MGTEEIRMREHRWLSQFEEQDESASGEQQHTISFSYILTAILRDRFMQCKFYHALTNKNKSDDSKDPPYLV